MAPSEQVTVVIPTKNRRELLRKAVASVLSQVDVDVRVLVVDDGSEVPASTHLPQDARIDVLRNEHSLGVAGARNRGLDMVTTTWVSFLDDDDVWSTGKLRRQLEALHSSGYRWACSASVNFSPEEVLGVTNEPDVDDLSALMLTGNHVPAGGSGVLADSRLVRDVGGFDPALASLADWDCWLRLAQQSPVARVGQTDVGYRVSAGGMAHDVAKQEAELRRMTEKYSALPQPLVLRPAPAYRAYLARMEYRAGNWPAAWARTWELVVGDRRPGALLMPLRQLSPEPVQRLVRRRQLAALAARRPYQDWSWITQHMRPVTEAA